MGVSLVLMAHQSQVPAGPQEWACSARPEADGDGWMLAAPQLFLQGLQPQVSSYLGPGWGGGGHCTCYWKPWGSFMCPPCREQGLWWLELRHELQMSQPYHSSGCMT